MVELEYIQDKNMTEDYQSLLKEYHGERYPKFVKRQNWYKQYSDYRVLLARLDGKPIGQSCAYKVPAMFKGEPIEIWWSVDSFVLSSARGHGIGKKLQKKLHEDLPHFSSAWYSPTNGHIKKKCGANELADLRFCYYPVSSFFCPFLFLVTKKLFGKGLRLNMRLPYFYSGLNGFCRSHKGFVFKEMKSADFNQSFYDSLAEMLSDKSFYVKRDKHFFETKYFSNPELKYHAFSVYKNDVMQGFFAFTEVKDMQWVLASVKGIKMLDAIIRPGSGLTQRDILLSIARYYKQRKMTLDGILSLQDADYYPRYAYPHPSTPLLTTIASEKLHDAYVSYIDQDMEH